MDKIRIVAAGILLGVIIVTSIMAFVNKDSLFQNKVEITYPDRCKEVFINKELVSPECTQGRKLLEDQKNFSKSLNNLGSGLVDYDANVSSN